MIWNQGNQLGHVFSHSQKKQKHIYLVLKSNLCLCICLLEVRRFKCDTFAQLFLCIEIEVFEFLCMNLFGKYGFWHANQLQFLLLQCVCVCVEIVHLNLHEFVCICACWWSQWIRDPAGLSGEALTSVMICQRSKQTKTERWIQAVRCGLLSRRNAQTHQPMGKYTHSAYRVHIHTLKHAHCC